MKSKSKIALSILYSKRQRHLDMIEVASDELSRISFEIATVVKNEYLGKTISFYPGNKNIYGFENGKLSLSIPSEVNYKIVEISVHNTSQEIIYVLEPNKKGPNIIIKDEDFINFNFI